MTSKCDWFQALQCNRCGGTSSRPFLPAYIRSVGHAKGLGLFQCTNCGLVYLYPQLDWKSLAEFYPESYYLEDSRARDGPASRVAEALELHGRGVVVVPGGRLLDVGCGSGKFLLRMKERMDVFGIEPGSYGYQICRRRGLDVQNTFLEAADYQANSFDVITLNHVLEHVPNPKETLSHVRGLLRDSGFVIIQVPNLRSFAFLVSREYFFHLDVPRHLFHFTRKTLEAYLKAAGLKPVKVRYYASGTAILESLWLKRRGDRISSYDKGVAQRSRLPMLVLELVSTPYKVLLNKLQLGDAIEIVATPARRNAVAGDFD